MPQEPGQQLQPASRPPRALTTMMQPQGLLAGLQGLNSLPATAMRQPPVPRMGRHLEAPPHRRLHLQRWVHNPRRDDEPVPMLGKVSRCWTAWVAGLSALLVGRGGCGPSVWLPRPCLVPPCKCLHLAPSFRAGICQPRRRLQHFLAGAPSHLQDRRLVLRQPPI